MPTSEMSKRKIFFLLVWFIEERLIFLVKKGDILLESNNVFII